MSAIFFSTPGTIDMRAFTTMGVNAKPNTTAPIGYFGTGLKYAVAVLCRLGAHLTVYAGGRRYVFHTRKMDFRGTDFHQIVMRRDSWVGGPDWRIGRNQRLPFTTQYGRNWEAWMAYRELRSNTMDEAGETYEVAPERVEGQLTEELGSVVTLIVVDGCEDFTKAHRDSASIFVDLSERPVVATLPGVTVLEGETQRLFYQGMRAKDIGKPALHTYNFTTGQSLTEDRQLAHEWQVRAVLANTIAQSDDEALIEKVVTADEERWEHGLEPSSWITPSRAFHDVMMRRPRGVGGGWGGYYRTHDARPEAVRKDLWRDALRPWRVDSGDVLASDGTALFSKPFNMHDQQWATLAAHVVRLANRAGDELGAEVEQQDIVDLRAGLVLALSHMEHMAAWIGSQAAGYSFESLGEDMPGLRRLVGQGPGAEEECPGCLNTRRVCHLDRLCERAREDEVGAAHEPMSDWNGADLQNGSPDTVDDMPF